MQIHHETIRLTRTFSAPPSRLFAAYLDTREREVWSAPSETAAVRIENAVVRTGGSETTRCGAKDDMRYRTEVAYHRVETDRLIAFSETLFEGDDVLMSALITFEYRETDGRRTQLVLTDQIVSFVGTEGVEGHRAGFGQALENLTRCVEA